MQRNLVIAVVAVALCILAIVYAIVQKIEANKQINLAERYLIVAEQSRKDAEAQVLDCAAIRGRLEDLQLEYKNCREELIKKAFQKK